MFVRLTIGRQAGSVVEMPYAAAQSCLAMGTALPVTDADIVGAGFQPPHVPAEAMPETVPLGYLVQLCGDGGFDVIGPDNVRINQEPVRNCAAARSVALRHHEAAAAALALAALPVLIADGWRDLPWPELRTLAQSFDPLVRTKDDSIAAIERELAARAASA